MEGYRLIASEQLKNVNVSKLLLKILILVEKFLEKIKVFRDHVTYLVNALNCYFLDA